MSSNRALHTATVWRAPWFRCSLKLAAPLPRGFRRRREHAAAAAAAAGNPGHSHPHPLAQELVSLLTQQSPQAAQEQGQGQQAGPLSHAGGPRPLPSAEVLSFLSEHGLDVEQLQQDQPEALSQLTLPLAEVLVEAQSACAPSWGEEGPGSGSAAAAAGNAWCAVPSEMLARIWLLATSAGLSAADIVELWRQESQFFTFKASSARRTIGCIASACAWLRGLGLSAEEVSAVWNAQMRMFIFPGDTLAAGLRALQRRCALSAEQQRAFLLRAGRYLTPNALQPLLSKVDAIITAAPGAQPYLAQLLSSGGEGLLDELDLALRKVADLRKYGFSRQQLRQVLALAPMALAADMRQEIKPSLDLLQKSLGGRSAAVQAVCARPELLQASALGLSVEGIRQLVVGAAAAQQPS